MAEAMRFASILIDFENVYYFLHNNTAGADVSGVAMDMVRQLRQHLEEKYQEQAISLDAYADFDRINAEVLGPLYLAGVETHNVLGTDHKNAADMRLCIDALEILYTRPKIESFVVVAGDRDYIPLIQHMKKHGRTVRVAGFPHSVSGDLRKIVGDAYFIDASQFIGDTQLVPRSRPAPASPVVKAVATPPVPTAPGPPPVPAAPAPVVNRELDSYERVAVETMLTHFGGKREVWMSPYLHRLRAALPEITEPERKDVIRGLESKGAVRVERRPGENEKGEKIEYSVMIINWNHPDIHHANPGT